MNNYKEFMEALLDGEILYRDALLSFTQK